jgi:hypothetical protein
LRKSGYFCNFIVARECPEVLLRGYEHKTLCEKPPAACCVGILYKKVNI